MNIGTAGHRARSPGNDSDAENEQTEYLSFHTIYILSYD